MGGANNDETASSHGLAQAAITAPSQRRLTHGSRALKRPLLAHIHPASCQPFSGTQQLAVQAHVPIFYSCGVIHMHLAMHRKVTQADADPCIRPSTYCCCARSSKMLAHRGARTPVTVTHLTPVTGLVQAPGPCGSAPPPDESRASSESVSRRMCTTHTSRPEHAHLVDR